MLLRTFLFFTLLTFLLPVFAAETIKIELEFDPDLKNGKRVYEICASCHLPEGWGNENGTYPQLAGQNKAVLIKQLLDTRNGIRDNPIMYPFVQERTIGGYQSLADVVAYISTLPMTPGHGKGPWRDRTPEYAEGEKLYTTKCLSCHGIKGEGSNEQAIPRIQGQHFEYTMRQAQKVSQGVRHANPAMEMIVKNLTPDQLRKVINYVSYLPVPEKDKAPSFTWRNPDFRDD